MSCPFCASDNPSKAQFCLACGAELPRQNASDASADALPIGTLLMGTYAVESVLGQGGFGITYCCHDQMLDRPVAVKEFFPSGCRREDAAVQPSRGLSEANFSEARAQFLAEARLLARCHHAGIVGVHTAFEANSTAYMVMELLHGSHLAQLLEARGGRLTEAEAVPLIESAGEALQWVHDKGLLHRDIKPENIIVCDDGRVMLIDFGTAREYAQGQAQGHTIVVTPGYAPLEQYAKQAKRGAFTDVYGLAATLYHLLTGQAPPAASDRAVGVQLRPVREQNPQISQGVARAIEAGLEMEIARRPQSVREFLELMHAPTTQAVEIAAFETDSSRHQNPLTDSQSDEQDALRRLSHAPANFFSTAHQARQQMLNELLPDPTVQPVQLAPLVTPPPILPILPTTTTAVTKPTALFSNLDPNSPSNLPSNGGGYLTQPAGHFDDPLKSVFWWVGGMALFVAFLFFAGSLTRNNQSSGYSSSGGYYSSPGRSYSSPNYSSSYQPTSPAYSTSTISASDTAREAARQEIESAPAIFPASVETLPISKVKTSQPKTSANTVAEIPYILTRGLAEFSSDGQMVAYLDGEGVVRVWSLSKHRVVSSLPQAKNYPPSLIRFSPDAKIVALTYQNQNGLKRNDRVTVWNLAREKSLGTLSVGAKESLLARTVLPDGKVLITKSSSVSSQQSLFLWDPRTGKQSAPPMRETDDGYRLTFSADGQQMATGDKTGRIRWWDAKTGVKKGEQTTSSTFRDFQDSPFYRSNLSGQGNLSDPLPVESLRFSRNGSYLASRNAVQTRVIDAKMNEIGALPIGGYSAFAVSPDGKFVVEGGSQVTNQNVLWNVRNQQKVRLQGALGLLKAWTFSPDGKRIIGLSSSPEGVSLVTWLTDAKPIVPFSGPQITTLSVPSSSSRSTKIVSLPNRLSALHTGQRLEIYRFDGSLLNSLDVGQGAITEMAFSPDDLLISGRGSKGETRIWNVQTEQQVVQLEALEAAQNEKSQTQWYRGDTKKSLIFSPDSSLIARTGSAQSKNLIEVWSLKKTPRRIASLPLDQPAARFTFSSDNRTLLCSEESGKLRFYDVASQKLVAQTQNGPAFISHLVATEQGVAVVSQDKSGATITLYEVPSSGDATGLVPTRKPRGFLKKSRVTITDVRSQPHSISISPDGRFVAATSYFKSSSEYGVSPQNSGIGVWQLTTGALMQKLPVGTSGGSAFPSGMPFASSVNGLAFSPDGSQLLCNSHNIHAGQQQVMSWQVPPSEETSR